MVDYSSGWWTIAKALDIKPMPESNEYDKKDIARVRNQCAQHDFWASLGWEYGGEELWREANKLFENVHILSSTAARKDVQYHKMVEGGKLAWLKKNLTHLDPQNIHIVSEGVEKAKFANHLSILVDDRRSTIEAFIQAGGYGILHNSKHYRKTIHELEELARPMNLGEIAKRLPIVSRQLWYWD